MRSPHLWCDKFNCMAIPKEPKAELLPCLFRVESTDHYVPFAWLSRVFAQTVISS
jgi:hypothetical protein